MMLDKNRLGMARKSLVIIALAGFVALMPAPMMARAADCLPWSQARPILDREGLIGSEQASELAQGRFEGETLVNVKFCRTGERFVYFVFLLRPDDNKLRRVVVDASDGRF